MQTLIEAKALLSKRLVLLVEESETEILDEAQGEYGGDRLREVLELGEKIVSLERAIWAASQAPSQQPSPEPGEQPELGFEVMTTMVVGPPVPASFTQVVAAIQRQDYNLADELLGKLLPIPAQAVTTMNVNLQARIISGERVGMWAASLDHVMLTNGRKNDALLMLQELFGASGDIALHYLQHLEHNWSQF